MHAEVLPWVSWSSARIQAAGQQWHRICRVTMEAHSRKLHAQEPANGCRVTSKNGRATCPAHREMSTAPCPAQHHRQLRMQPPHHHRFHPRAWLPSSHHWTVQWNDESKAADLDSDPHWRPSRTQSRALLPLVRDSLASARSPISAPSINGCPCLIIIGTMKASSSHVQHAMLLSSRCRKPYSSSYALAAIYGIGEPRPWP